MFERFTADAREVVVSAQRHARRLGHTYIGCEHLLVAVVASPSPVAAELAAAGVTQPAVESAIAEVLAGPRDDRAALRAIGIDLDKVRDTIEASFGPGALAPALTSRSRWPWRRRECRRHGSHLPFTPRAKRCLELSLREAIALGDRHIGVEHMALALCVREDTVAWRVLTHLGQRPAELRQSVLKSLRRTA